jgi:hypothetical protein
MIIKIRTTTRVMESVGIHVRVLLLQGALTHQSRKTIFACLSLGVHVCSTRAA